jgi:ApaG protein
MDSNLDYVFSGVSNGMRIEVKPTYNISESEPKQGKFLWHYEINITNLSEGPVQLIRRHWFITNAHGKTEIVYGSGVIGQQPVIESGEFFTYTSQVLLSTSSGFMKGQYQIKDLTSHDTFECEIPEFILDVPNTKIAVN